MVEDQVTQIQAQQYPILPSVYVLNEEQLYQYLDRIQFYSNSSSSKSLPSPTLETLIKITNLHTKSIPFGNLDLIYYKKLDTPLDPIINIHDPYSTRGINVDPVAIFSKLVLNKREGYCFEQNTLLRSVLFSLKFDVISVVAKLIDFAYYSKSNQVKILTPTHLICIIKVDGLKYLADVGFGAKGASLPLLLDDATIPTVSENLIQHRVVKVQQPEGMKTSFEQQLYNFQVKSADVDSDKWNPLYYFTISPIFLIDLVSLNYYVSTDPNKIFQQHTILSKFVNGGQYVLMDKLLKIRVNGKPEQVIELADETERRQAYSQYFGIELDPSTTEFLPTKFDVKLGS